MKKGFSTLFIVIILGSLTLSLSIMFSTASLRTIKNSSSTKYQQQAKNLAYICAEIALNELKGNNSIIVNNQIYTHEGEDCVYSISNLGGDNRRVETSATQKGFTKNLLIETNSFNPIGINIWNEF